MCVIKVKVTLLFQQPIDLVHFHFTLISPAIPNIQLFRIQGQSHDQGQNSWLHLMPSVQFDMFIFHFVVIGSFCHKTQQIKYLTLRIQGQGHCQGQT